jgi:hypothetical protein
MQLSSLLRFGLALAVCCFSQSGTAQTQPKPATGTISGRVTLEGKPAPGITVLAVQESGQLRQASAQAKTDAEGHYRLTGLPAGSFTVHAAAREYVSADDNWRAALPGRTVMLSAGEQLEGQDFALVRGGVITGRVTNAAGQPLIEETVHLFRLNERGQRVPYRPSHGPPLRTDDRGMYRAYGLSAGRYLVAAGQDANSNILRDNTGGRRAYALTFHPGAREQAEAKVVEVSPGSEAAEIDIALGSSTRGQTIHVRVVEAETGRPLPGLSVGYGILHPRFNSINSIHSFPHVTDSQGEIELESVLPGRYAVFLGNRADGKAKEFYAEPQPFEIIEGEPAQLEKRIEIVVRRGLQITGNLVFEGIRDPALLKRAKGLRAYLTLQGNKSLRTPVGNPAVIAPDFSFRFSGIEPGQYTMSIQSNETRGFGLVRVEHNGAVLGQAFDVNESLSGMRIVVTYGNARILGQIQFNGLTLPANARVHVAAYPSGSPHSTHWSATADAQGKFVLEYLTADLYEVRVSVGVPVEHIDYGMVTRTIFTGKQQVTVGATGDTQVTITLNPTAQGRQQ